MEKIEPYLINGVFFQPGVGFGVGYGAGGLRAKVFQLVRHNFFTGVFSFSDPSSPHNGSGQMMDLFGDSELTSVTMTDTRFAFNKKYTGRGDTIRYIFEKKRGDIWVGTFAGAKTGVGDVNCLVTKVTEDLFIDPHSRA